MKHMKISIRAFALALAFPCGTLTLRAQTNLVANGSFEAGPAGTEHFTSWGWLGPADSFSNYGVAKSSASPDVAQQGSYYAYFRGHPTDASQDCLGATVNVRPGGLYNISYYLGTDGSTLGTGAAMWVVIGSSFGIDLNQDVMLTAFFPNSSNALPYQKFSTNYLATSTSPILSFHGINAGPTNSPGANAILLDNVSVVLTTPPLTLAFTLPGNNLRFTWPYTNSPYRLQTLSSQLSTSSNSWVTLTNTPINVGTNNQIILPASVNTTMQFFRLTLP